MMERIKNLLSRVRKTRRIWLAGVLILLVGGGYGIYKSFFSSSEVTYLTALASQGTITDAIQATGTLEPVRKVGLSFKNTETITFLNVKDGDQVTEGQVLAEQDTRQFAAAVAQAARDVAQSEASIKNSTMTRDKAEKTLRQTEALFEVGVCSQDELDNARDEYERSELDLNSAHAQLENSRYRLSTAQDDLAATKLVAPFAGIASVVNGDVGQRSGGGSGSEVNAFITLISDELQLKTMVNEVDMGRVKVGQDVEFTSTAYSGKTFRGKVMKISPEATTVSNVQFYQAIISVEDPEHLLYPGMSTAVSIIVARKSDVVMAPMLAQTYAESYIRSSGGAAARNINQDNGSASGSGAGARTRAATTPGSAGQDGEDVSSRQRSSDNQRRGMLVVLEGDQPVLRPVTIGLNDGQNMEIVEGINPGDKVVIGTNQFTPASTNTNRTTTNQQGGQNRQPQGGGNMMMFRAR